MILDLLSQAATYDGLGSRFDKAFSYLQNFHPATADGRVDLEGDDLYALVQSFETQAPEERTFESHKLYADIHYILTGHETIYYRQASLLNPKGPYDAAKDARYYHDHDDFPLFLDAGSFAVFWPQDGHKPGCLWSAPTSTHKVVIKLRLH